MKIKFHNIQSAVFLDPSIKISECCIGYNDGYFTQKDDKKYYNIKEIEIDIPQINNDAIDNNITGQLIYLVLENGLIKLYEFMSKIAAFSGSFCDIQLPIEFSINNKFYVNTNFGINHKGVGNKFFPSKILDTLDNVQMDDIFFIYRESQDHNYPLDWKFLNIWRFFEYFYKMKGLSLVTHLSLKYKKYRPSIINNKWEKLSCGFFNECYTDFRCATAHASHTGKIFIPKKIIWNPDMSKRHNILSSIARELLLTFITNEKKHKITNVLGVPVNDLLK